MSTETSQPYDNLGFFVLANPFIQWAKLSLFSSAFLTPRLDVGADRTFAYQKVSARLILLLLKISAVAVQDQMFEGKLTYVHTGMHRHTQAHTLW